MSFLTAILISLAFICIGIVFMTILAKLPEPKTVDSAVVFSALGFLFILAGFIFALMTAIEFLKNARIFPEIL